MFTKTLLPREAHLPRVLRHKDDEVVAIIAFDLCCQLMRYRELIGLLIALEPV